MNTESLRAFEASSLSTLYSRPSYELFAGTVASLSHLSDRASLAHYLDEKGRYPNVGSGPQDLDQRPRSFWQPEASSGWSTESVAGSDANLTEHQGEQGDFVPDWHDFGSYRQYATRLLSFGGDSEFLPPVDPSRLWFLEWAERGSSPTGMERACEDLRNRVAEEYAGEGDAWWETSSSEGDVIFTPSETDCDEPQGDDRIGDGHGDEKGVADADDDELEDKDLQRLQGQGPNSAEESPLCHITKLTPYEEYLVLLWNDYFGDGSLRDWQRLMADLGLGCEFNSKSQCRRVSCLNSMLLLSSTARRTRTHS